MGAKIGVVTVTYNSAAFVREFLQCCLAQDFRDHVLYVVDNKSKDNSLKEVGRLHDPRIVLLPQEANLGVAAGNNIGILRALADKCTHVLLLNNDVEFGPGLFSGLLHALTADPRIAAVCPKIHFAGPERKLWWAGGGYLPWYMYDNRHWGFEEIDRGQYDQPRYVDVATTCCMLLERRIFDEIGLMDERYFVYFDDTDFCWRLRRSGHRILYAPKIELQHKVSQCTGGGFTPFTLFHESRNRFYFLRKNLPRFWRVYSMCFYFVHSLTKLAILRENWTVFATRVRGMRAGLSMPL